MVKPRRLKDESIDTYNERASKLYYSNGYHIAEIAEKLKINEVEVYNYVATGHKITTEAERAEMISLYNAGYSISAIAKIFGRSRYCIRQRIESPAKLNIKSTDITDKQLDKMIEMAKKGYCAEDIAKEIGISEYSVKYRLSHTGIKVNNSTRIANEENKNISRISKLFKRSKDTICKHFHKA